MWMIYAMAVIGIFATILGIFWVVNKVGEFVKDVKDLKDTVEFVKKRQNAQNQEIANLWEKFYKLDDEVWQRIAKAEEEKIDKELEELEDA